MPSLDSGDGFISNSGWSLSPNSTQFPDPFMDMASLAMPPTINYALRWTEYIAMSNGCYSRALDRVLSYFITDIELSDIDSDEDKEKISDYINNPTGVDMLDDIHTAGFNYMVYGNDFSSIIVPFRRYLSCKKCGLELPLKNVYTIPEFKFKWEDYNFNAYCPRCKYHGNWKHIDRRSTESSKIKIKHWSPHEIDILWDPYTDDIDYIWKIPEEYRKLIKEGHLFHLERANWEIIQCVKDNNHLKFDKDVIYHMKENTLAGIRNRGWGISRILSNFRQAWYVQVLHRYNEAIALDYVIPFRLITPAPGPGSADQARDALLNMNMGGYMSQVQSMLRMRRRDPAMWNTLPFPVQYQALGGDATQLAPRDLLDQGLEILLNNAGVPMELYKGSLQIQSAPAALRLFESSWSHLVHNLNGYLQFVVGKLGQLLNWDAVTAKLQKVTFADDLQRQMAKLQLMMGGQVSKQTGLKSVGINYYDETKRQYEEQKFEAEQQAEATEDMDQAATMQQMGQPQQQQGDPSQGGQPQQGSGSPMGDASAQMQAGMPSIPTKPTTPQEMQAKAQELAQQILAMPESQKDSQLIQLKKTDPTMHAIVSKAIEDIRRQAQTQGGSMLMQQMQKKSSKRKSILDRDYKPPFNTLP